MGDTGDHLEQWVGAGVLAPEAAEAIRAYERSRAPNRDTAPGGLEALLYLGIVVLSVGVFALLAQQWRDLESWARLLAIGVPTGLLLAAGAVMRLNDAPEMQRGSQAAWLAGTGLFAGTLGVLFNEYRLGFPEQDDRGRILTITTATFLVALALWALNESHAQLLAVAASGFALGQAVGNWPDEFSQTLAGMTVLTVGIVGLALIEWGAIKPVASGRLFFAVLAIAGPYEAGVGDGPLAFELLAGAFAAATIGYAVLRGSFSLLLIGVAAAFAILVSFIFEHFEERIGAPAALILSGGLLVAAVLLVARYRQTKARRVPG